MFSVNLIKCENRMIRKLSNVEAVIFDMDGVIVDSIPLHKESFSRIFKKFSVPFSLERFNEINGMTVEDSFNYIRDNYEGEFDVQQAIEEKRRADLKIAKRAPLIKGAIETLEKLHHKGFTLVLATSSPRREVEIILNRFNLFIYFDCLMTGDEVEKSKPHPEIFEKCVCKLKLNKTQCVVIEDSPDGIRAAGRAGIRCIALTSNHGKEELGEADVIIDELSQIPRVIGKAGVGLDDDSIRANTDSSKSNFV
jgi:HAD superfamily hydrolase (TIGR01509 family)